MVANPIIYSLVPSPSRYEIRQFNLRSCPLSIPFGFALPRERCTNETKTDPDRRLGFIEITSPYFHRGVSNGLCEHLPACEQCVYFCEHEQ